MANLNSYQVHGLTLAAGEWVQLDITGEYIGCIKSNAAFKVGADDNTPQPMEQGLTFRTVAGESFTSIQILNTSASSNSIELAVGEGQITDARLSLTADLTLSANNGISDLIDISIAAGVSAQVAAVNLNRREILIQNLSGNTSLFRVGATTAASARGVELMPGQTLTLETTAEIWAFNSDAGAQSLAVVEVLK